MKRYFLGCDVSEGYADFVVLDENKKIVEDNFQLDDTAMGHKKLYDNLNLFFEKYPEALVHAAVESTGGYEKNWYSRLLKLQDDFNIKVARINPIGISHDSKAGMKRNLTDKISAVNIAEYLTRHPEKVSYGEKDTTSSLKKMWRFIKILKKQQGELFNQLESLLYSGNPELIKYCRDGVPQWLLKLLHKYPTSLKLSRARLGTISKIPFISETRAEKLIKEAKGSVAAESDEITELLIVSTVTQLISLNKTIKTQEKNLEKICNWAEVDLLESIQGVGRMTAIVMMLYIQDINRFSSAKKLASYLGLHPEYKESGDGSKKGSYRLSKKGQKDPRAQLYMGAMSAKAYNPVLKKLYEKKIKEEMCGKSAIFVCIQVDQNSLWHIKNWYSI